MARPRSFDPVLVVDRAMHRFWRHGFAGTTPQDLVEATGLHRSSLYNAYGSKRGLFLAAIERYEQEETARLLAALDGDGPPLERLRLALRLVVVASAEDDGRGCLVTNTAVEVADPEVQGQVAGVLRGQREAFARVLREARDAGEVDAELDVDAAATALLAAINGLRATARAGVRPGDPDAVVAALLDGAAPRGSR